MSTGGTINTTLTLDASKFSAALDKATSDVAKFDKNLASATKISESFEKNVKGLSASTSLISERFKLLDNTISTFVARLAKTSAEMEGIAKATSSVAKASDGLAKSVGVSKDAMSGMTRQSELFKTAMDALGPSIAKASKSYLELTEATNAAARSAKEATSGTVASRLKALQEEQAINAKLIAERKATVSELQSVESRLTASAAFTNAEAKRFFGRNAAKAVPLREEAAAYDAEAALVRKEINAIQHIIKELEWKNRELAKGVELESQNVVAARKAQQIYRDAVSERVAKERELKQIEENAAKARLNAIADQRSAARVAANEQREQVAQLSQMWKGMAQMWAASKIERGLMASVTGAGDFERQMTSVKALNYTDGHNKTILDEAWNTSKALGFISVLDSVKSRMSAIASIGYDNAEVINRTLNTAIMAANNLNSLGFGHGDLQTMIRNMYGVVEMRQQTADPNATIGTFNQLQKISLGTQGKVQTSDIETLLRRLGQGAAQLSDHGMYNLAAIIDQFKIAGGEGGGGAASGVSTVGTSFKMMQAYALGKGLSNEAVREFAGAGILKDGVIDFSKDRAGVLRDAKHGGFKDAQLWLQDPVAAVQKIMPQIIAYTKKKENVGYFYEGRDTNDKNNELSAVSMYLARLGITTSAAQALMTAGDYRSKERIEHQVGTMSGSKNVEAVNKDLSETYTRNLQEVQSVASNIGMTIGNTVLPIVKELLVWFKKFLDATLEWAKENPMLVKLSAIAAAAGGVALAFAGFVKTFGIIGGLGTLISGMATSIAGAAGASSAWAAAGSTASAIWAGIGTLISGFTSSLMGAVGWMARLVAPEFLLAWGSRVGSMLPMIASGFMAIGRAIMVVGQMALRALPLVGAAMLGWDLGGIAAKFEVFGLTIHEHVMNAFVKIEVGFRRMMLDIEEGIEKAKFWSSDKSGLDQIAKDREALGKYEDFMLIKPKAPAVGPSSNPEEQAKYQKTIEDGANKGAKDYDPKAASDQNEKLLKMIDSGSPKKTPRDFEDMFLRSLADVTSKASIQKMKLESVLTGKASYRDQAMAEFQSHWLGGDFDKGHDPKNRMFTRDGATFDAKKGWGLEDFDPNSSRSVTIGNETRTVKAWVEAWVEARAAQKQVADETKATTISLERQAAAAQDADDAATKLAEGALPLQTDAMRALRNEFARLEKANPEAGRLANDPKSDYAIAKSKAITDRARADLDSFTIDTINRSKQIQAQLTIDSNGRAFTQQEMLQKEYDLTVETENQKYEVVKEALEKRLLIEGIAAEEIAKIKKQLVDAEKSHQDLLNLMARQQAEKMRTPLEKLVDQWQDTGKQLKEAQADWANQMMNGLIAISTGGVKSFKDFKNGVKDIFRNIMNDVSAMLMKKSMGGIVGSITDGIGSMFGGLLGIDAGTFKGKPDGTPTNPIHTVLAGSGFGGLKADTAQESFFSKLTDGFKGVWDKVSGYFGGIAQGIMGVFSSIGGSFGIGGGSGGWGSVLGSVGNLAGSLIGNSNFFSAGGSFAGNGPLLSYGTGAGYEWLSNAGSYVSDAASSVASSAGEWISSLASFFANGGIMTGAGPVELRAYANGGIANKPQLAMFGEGSMPEAYVPLPDGRRIPVAMQGGRGGENVTINIVVNQDGGESQSGSGGASQADWEKLANKVKIVVKDELATQQRPGGMLWTNR